MKLAPQAALEAAVVSLLRSTTDGMGLPDSQCGRTFDANPPARCGPRYVSVWSDNQRESVGGSKTCLDEIFGLYVTVTIRLTRPQDRWDDHNDEMELLVNRIRVLVGKDTWDHRVVNAANTLMGRRLTDVAGFTLPVGFREALYYRGADPIQKVGPEWFSATLESGSRDVGIAQRIGFYGARLTQDWANAE